MADARETETLPEAELFTLWALRQWVSDYRRDFSAGWDQLARLFCQGGVEDGLVPFHSMMSMLPANASRTIDIRCVQCRRVSEDEELLLSAVRLLQNGDLGMAAALLEDVLPPSPARIAAQAGRLFAIALRDIGLRLRTPPAPGHWHVGQPSLLN